MNKLLLLIFIFFIANLSPAQEVYSTTGDYFSSSTGSLSWTIGELLDETVAASNSMLTQGFQQPSIQILNTFDLKISNLHVVIFPNPAADFVTIQLSGEEAVTENIFELYNSIGQKIISDSFEKTYVISMECYISGLYFIKISSGSTSNLFRLIKS